MKERPPFILRIIRIMIRIIRINLRIMTRQQQYNLATAAPRCHHITSPASIALTPQTILFTPFPAWLCSTMGQQEGWELLHISTIPFGLKLVHSSPLLEHGRLNPTRNETQLLNQELLSCWLRGQGEDGGSNSPCVAMKWLDLW